MSNVHGLGNFGNNGPNRNNPQPRNNDHNGGRAADDGDSNGGIFDNFNRPVIENELQLAH